MLDRLLENEMFPFGAEEDERRLLLRSILTSRCLKYLSRQEDYREKVQLSETENRAEGSNGDGS